MAKRYIIESILWTTAVRVLSKVDGGQWKWEGEFETEAKAQSFIDSQT